MFEYKNVLRRFFKTSREIDVQTVIGSLLQIRGVMKLSKFALSKFGTDLAFNMPGQVR